MNILIVDDESLARYRIQRIIEENTDHQIIGEASNGEEALKAVDRLHPDVVFLDIRMPGMDGLEVARHLADLDEPPCVIFTTAYDEYALEAFKVNAADYLLKPVRSEKLLDSLTKALKPNKLQWRKLNTHEDGSTKSRTYLTSRSYQGLTLIKVDDIFSLRAEHKYVTVNYKGGSSLIEDPLKDLEEEFGNRFLRVHRNSLVAVKYILGIVKDKEGNSCIQLDGTDEIVQISRRLLPGVRKTLKNLHH